MLFDTHHDGSAAYVRLGDGQDGPAVGCVVALRMASRPADPIDAVWIRTTYDAEPTFHPGTGRGPVLTVHVIAG